MTSDAQIILNDTTFRCLLQKFAEEIAELEAAVRGERANTELQTQLQEAVTQSRTLQEELLQVFVMYQDAQRSDCRPFSAEECSALKYFGFAIPDNGRPPPALSDREQGYIRLPSQRVSQDREWSPQNETETDVADALMGMRFAQRMGSPEQCATPGANAKTSPAVKEERFGAAAYFGSPSPSKQGTVASQRTQKYTLTDRGTLEDELMLRVRESLEREWHHERTAMKLSHEEVVMQLQQQVIELRTAVVESREKAASTVDEIEASCKAKLSHSEQRVERLSEEIDRLKAEIDSQRHESDELKHELVRRNAEATRLLDEQQRRDREIERQRLEMSSSIRQLATALDAIRTGERSELLQECRELRDAIHSQQHRLEQLALEQNGSQQVHLSTGSLQTAIAMIQSVESESSLPPTFTLESCDDADEIDTAVIRTLNDLALPFVVSIRRLGRGGDYFIDRRIQVRVVDGQPMVRQQVLAHSGQPAAPYEHLGQYILALYAPLLDFEEAAEEVRPVRDDDAVVSRVAALQEQHQQLLRSLSEKQQLLLDHNRRVAAELSPSPTAQRQSNPGWRRPPSPSPMAQPNEPPMRLRDEVNDALKRGQQSLLQKSAAQRQKHPGTSTVRSQPDLSQLTSQELEQLKRAALAQQLREMKKLQGRR